VNDVSPFWTRGAGEGFRRLVALVLVLVVVLPVPVVRVLRTPRRVAPAPMWLVCGLSDEPTGQLVRSGSSSTCAGTTYPVLLPGTRASQTLRESVSSPWTTQY
jgi:hypothetical protein